MAKKQSENSTKKEKQRRVFNNKRRGSDEERKIVNELKAIGFNVVTSRSESKAMDDKKVDIIDLNSELPNIQVKRCIKYPDYISIRNSCPIKDKEFVLFWNQQKPTEKTFRSVGEMVIVSKDFFYKLIQKYYDKM